MYRMLLDKSARPDRLCVHVCCSIPLRCRDGLPVGVPGPVGHLHHHPDLLPGALLRSSHLVHGAGIGAWDSSVYSAMHPRVLVLIWATCLLCVLSSVRPSIKGSSRDCCSRACADNEVCRLTMRRSIPPAARHGWVHSTMHTH